jgi:hypothetical protein
MTTKTKRIRSRKAIQQVPESIINNAPRTFTEADFPIGTGSRQGDFYLIRIASVPAGAKARKSRQIAEGNTQGSRHVVTVGNVCDCDPVSVIDAIVTAVPKLKGQLQPQYIGPVFETVGGVASLEHPEHGHQHWRGEMAIACVCQRNLDAEEREQRTMD